MGNAEYMGAVFKIPSSAVILQDPAMLALSAFVLLTSVASLLQPANGFRCSECVDEMHGLGWMVKKGAGTIMEYLQANYCPTLGDEDGGVEFCRENLAEYYTYMLFAVVEHWFVDGAIHVCQTMGVCDAKASGYLPPSHPESRRYTCEECVEGLDWVKAYMEDPIIVAEMVVYLEQNFCLDEWELCKPGVVRHFPPMHAMAMEKFMIPVEICNQEPVCGATKPPMVHGM